MESRDQSLISKLHPRRGYYTTHRDTGRQLNPSSGEMHRPRARSRAHHRNLQRSCVMNSPHADAPYPGCTCATTSAQVADPRQHRWARRRHPWRGHGSAVADSRSAAVTSDALPVQGGEGSKFKRNGRRQHIDSVRQWSRCWMLVRNQSPARRTAALSCQVEQRAKGAADLGESLGAVLASAGAASAQTVSTSRRAAARTPAPARGAMRGLALPHPTSGP